MVRLAGRAELVEVVRGHGLDADSSHLGAVAGRDGDGLPVRELGGDGGRTHHDGVRPGERRDVRKAQVVEVFVGDEDEAGRRQPRRQLPGIDVDGHGPVQPERIVAEPMDVLEHRPPPVRSPPEGLTREARQNDGPATGSRAILRWPARQQLRVGSGLFLFFLGLDRYLFVDLHDLDVAGLVLDRDDLDLFDDLNDLDVAGLILDLRRPRRPRPLRRPRRPAQRPRVAGLTLVACGPLRPCSTSYSTSMSLSIAVTPSARPVTCTKMSLSFSCSMKPKAFSVENHLTLP